MYTKEIPGNRPAYEEEISILLEVLRQKNSLITVAVRIKFL